MHTVDRRLVVRLGIVGSASLALATLVIALLQSLGVPNASAVYLAAVVATAFVAGTWGAVVAAVASFLLYDYLFVLPLYTFTVADPGEWLNLIVLLFIGIVVGQLVALQRSRAEIAIAREREARALFQVSRALATRTSTPAVLPTIAEILRTETAMRRIWVALGPDDARERVAADTDPSERPAIPASTRCSSERRTRVLPAGRASTRSLLPAAASGWVARPIACGWKRHPDCSVRSGRSVIAATASPTRPRRG